MSKNIVTKSWPFALGATGTGGTYNSAMPLGLFQLSVGNFVPQKISMKIIAPRPDVERSSNSRYSSAHTSLEFEAEVKVVGGSYPLRYEITARSGTADVANATIGELRTYSTDRTWYGSANQKDYGVIRWTPASGDNLKTYSFTVKVTGQDGVTQTVTFSGTVDNSKFIFVEDGVTPGGSGTLADPFEDNPEWWIDATDSTHAGKLVYMKSGNYAAFPTSVFNPNKPLVYMRFPGDARPVFDGTAKDYTFDNTGMDDFWWSGIKINSTPGIAVSNCRFFECTTSTQNFDRATFWDNEFFNGKVGSAGTDNNGWIVCLRQGADHKFMSISSNLFDTADSSSNGFGTFILFNCTEFVAEHNVVKGYTGESLMKPKDSCNNISLRSNDLWDNNSTTQGVAFANQSAGALGSKTQEFCWNYIKQATKLCWSFNSAADLGDDNSPSFSYRNTGLTVTGKVINDFASKAASNLDTVEVISNIMVSPEEVALQENPHIIRNNSTPIDVNGSSDAEAEVFLINGIFDNEWFDGSTQTEVNVTTGLLQNAGLTFLGTHGAEIVQ